VAIDRAALHHVAVTARGLDVVLKLTFRADLFHRLADTEGNGAQPWEEVQNSGAPGLDVTIPRSEWISKVLAEIGTESYIWMELPVPALPAEKKWRDALGHLTTAERRFEEGADAEVLRSCHDAFTPLAEGPKGIVPQVADDEKRNAIDVHLRGFRNFLQNGRHPSRKTGLYTVDHRDAEFALAQTKFWLTYLARLELDAGTSTAV
jgi:hypothetical protein